MRRDKEKRIDQEIAKILEARAEYHRTRPNIEPERLAELNEIIRQGYKNIEAIRQGRL